MKGAFPETSVRREETCLGLCTNFSQPGRGSLGRRAAAHRQHPGPAARCVVGSLFTSQAGPALTSLGNQPPAPLTLSGQHVSWEGLKMRPEDDWRCRWSGGPDSLASETLHLM